ncbi:MAG: ABC transporter ATP-binding protein [Candidatus Onthomonas sp.]|nr:ABC transporter ATP-binding protein [Candidatus Onthomonas sp.]
MRELILHTRDLAVGYGGKALIDDIALTVRPGEILTLIGPNGAGKSTILKTITRQLKPVAGAIWLDGKALSGLPERDLARTMSILMTERVDPERMTCEDVVSAGRYPYTGRLGILSAQDRAQVAAAMELVHVAELRDREFSQISDGQRQRVMLARAICQEPKVLLLDEPTSYLDVRHKLELLAILKELALKQHVAVVMTLHELDLAQKSSDKILCVRQGQIDRYGTPEEIFSDGYIQQLYDITQGSYNESFGCLELQAPSGTPQVFVIGGGGQGITTYRQLQRMGVPFAAGVLHENDLDFPVAQALATQVISEQAFEPIGEAAFQQAADLLLQCRKVLCCLSEFGTMNQRNRALVELARSRGLLEE